MSTTKKRSRNSSSSLTSTMRRTPSLSELPRPTWAPRGGGPVDGLSAVSVYRRRSMDSFPVTETAAFLKICGFCRGNLGPDRDTFIYMGEAAFCSQECRQQRMNLDELMEMKCFPPSLAEAAP